ncbi:small RNA-binding protein 11, chloroplastic-like isoform X2 [Apium graveolens]|uniref:small RNA-binding protein 11, chloroplastic-like isoform X2 n=1 Tax=Apium graveolens TaxID=4045 RepID=UPI003D7B2FB8
MAAVLMKRLLSASGKIQKTGSFITHFNPNPNPNPTSTPFSISCRGLSFYTTDNGLSEAFSQYGQVVEATVVIDRVSDRSKGFGFVTFASEDEADKAVTEMNGKQLNGRVIFVDHAKPRARFDDGGMPIARGPPEPAANQ